MIDPRVWLVVGAAFVLCMTGSYFAGRHEGKKVERAAQAVAMSKALEQQRAEFQEKLDEQAKVAEQARIDQEAANADRDAASVARDGLQRSLSAAVERARKCAAVAGAGQTAYDAAGVLGRVLQESIDRNRALAAYADSARIAGTACQQSYDTLRKEP